MKVENLVLDSVGGYEQIEQLVIEGNSIIAAVGGYEQFEQLVKRGKQLQSQAIFELFAQLPLTAILFLKKGWDHLIIRQGSKDHGPALYPRQSNPT